MDTIQLILNSLHIDQTALIQFGLLVIFFNLIASVLFKKIQEVLEYREAKTSKKEGETFHLNKKVEDLAHQYKTKIEKTHQETQNKNEKKKAEILKKEKDILKSEEEAQAKEYEKRKALLVNEMLEKKKTIMIEASKLTDNLVEKFVK